MVGRTHENAALPAAPVTLAGRRRRRRRWMGERGKKGGRGRRRRKMGLNVDFEAKKMAQLVHCDLQG